ncbi:MAG: hypothetical protein FJ087_04025 [Deltaproteobacteria bacterium]|nr:hypothetical protein [Deltaproteobacteria bacterium]
MYQTYHSVEGGAMPGFSGGVLGIGLSGEYLVLDWLSVGAVLSKQWDWHDTRGDGTPKAVDAFSVGPRVTAYFHLSDLSHLFGAIDGGYFRRTGGKDLARNGYYVRGAMGIALRPAAHFLLAIGVAYRLSSTADDLDGDRWWMKTEWTTGHSLLLTIAPAILF